MQTTRLYNALYELRINLKCKIIFNNIQLLNLKYNKNAIYLYNKANYNGPAAEIKSEEIDLIDIKEYKELPSIPLDTINYYKEEHRKGNRFGIFPFIPHILSLGEVKVSNAEIISWGNDID